MMLRGNERSSSIRLIHLTFGLSDSSASGESQSESTLAPLKGLQDTKDVTKTMLKPTALSKFINWVYQLFKIN